MLVDKPILKNIPTADGDSYYIIPQDQEYITIAERKGKESQQLKEELTTVIDCETPVIKSSGLYGKKGNVLRHKEPHPIKTDTASNSETESSILKGFVLSELSSLKNYINEIFLNFENE